MKNQEQCEIIKMKMYEVHTPSDNSLTTFNLLGYIKILKVSIFRGVFMQV